MESTAILTGGRARRLGGIDKGLLQVGGLRIEERQRQVLTAAGLTPVVLVGRRIGQPWPASPAFPDVTRPGSALAGLYTALLTAVSARVLVLASDLPFVTAEFLHYLRAYVSDADAVVPCTAGRRHPLCAIYHRRAARALKAHLDAGRLRLHDVLDGLAVAEVGPEQVARFDPDGTLLLNVNTAEDYDVACRHVDVTPRRP